MSFDLVIRDCRLIDEDGERAGDIGVANGRIAAVGEGLGPGGNELDAAGRYLIPGGVDSHVHLGQLSSKGDLTADSFWTGSRSAAHGGTTTVVPFAAQHRGMSIGQVFEDAMQRAGAEMATDYGMHLIITDWNEAAPHELTKAAASGLTAVKIYLTYERLKVEGDLALELISAATGLGLPVMVHAELDELVTQGRDDMLAAGQLGATSHAHSHSRRAELLGVTQAIELADRTGAALYLAHISTPEAIDIASDARSAGIDVIAETCPHYLLLDESTYDSPMEQAAPFMCSPPLRGEADRGGLLERLASGAITIVASDHSPYTVDQKLPHGAKTTFTEAANGLPGIELRMSLLYTAAVVTGHLSMNDFVRLTAAAPARLCGMYPRKGSLDIGADADLVIWDETPWTAAWKRLHDNVGYTPYEGMELHGAAAAVVAGGEVVIDGPQSELAPGRGTFIPRSG